MWDISAGRMCRVSRAIALSLVVVAPMWAGAQGTAVDYARAEQLNQRLQGLVTGVAERPVWIANSNRFWYRVSVKGGNQFVLVNADTKAKADDCNL